MYLAIFGFLMAWGYDAPWYVWVIGFLLLCADHDRENNRIRNVIDHYES